MAALRLGAAAAAGVAVAWSAPAPAPLVPALCPLFGIRRRLDGPGIALTFDDGPHPQGTPAVLAELDRHGVPATFFLVGEQVDATHRSRPRSSPRGTRSRSTATPTRCCCGAHRRRSRARPRPCVSVIEGATGVSPTVYRPPYGVFSSGSLASAGGEAGQPTLWSRWGRDWGAHETPSGIAQRAADAAVAGDIILLHDADHYSSRGSWRRTVAALPAILDTILATGAPLVTLRRGCDRLGRQCPFPFVNQAR